MKIIEQKFGVSIRYKKKSVDINSIDYKDNVLVAIVKALLEIGNIPSTTRELSGIIIENNFYKLGGNTPYATVASRISQHFKRNTTGFGIPLLGKKFNQKKCHYYINQPGIAVGERFSTISKESVIPDLLDMKSPVSPGSSDVKESDASVPQLSFISHREIPALHLNAIESTDFQLSPVSPLHQPLELTDDNIIDPLQINNIETHVLPSFPIPQIYKQAPQQEFSSVDINTMDLFDFGNLVSEKKIKGASKFLEWFPKPCTLFEMKESLQDDQSLPVYLTQLEDKWFYVCWSVPVKKTLLRKRKSRASFTIGRYATSKATNPEPLASLSINDESIPFIRAVDCDMVNADSLLYAGQVVDEDKNVILSLETMRLKSDKYGNWLPLWRAQALAQTLCINQLDQFLSDSLSLDQFLVGKQVQVTSNSRFPGRKRPKLSYLFDNSPTLLMAGQNVESYQFTIPQTIVEYVDILDNDGLDDLR